VILHEQCSGTRGGRPRGDAAGAAARMGAAGAAKGTRRVEARRQARRDAARRGRRNAVWRHALPLWARSGITTCPFGACPSGFASAPASAAYRSKPNDWTRMVQVMGPRRFIGWLTRHDRGLDLATGGPGGGSRVAAATTSALRGARARGHGMSRLGCGGAGEHAGRACVGPGAGARGSTWGERAGARGCPDGELRAPAGAGALGAGASSAGMRGAWGGAR